MSTPRTDKAAIGFARILVEHGTPEKPDFKTTELVPADFARELEKELSTARAEAFAEAARICREYSELTFDEWRSKYGLLSAAQAIEAAGGVK